MIKEKIKPKKQAKPHAPAKSLKILKIAEDNFDYFRENTKHLAWVMMHYELMHKISRYLEDDFKEYADNPKYPIIDAGDRLPEKGDGNLLYDAWGITVSNSLEFNDVTDPKQMNPNKTLQDWCDIWLDEDYRYNSIFPDRRRVEDHLLCTNGTGMEWNKDGYIDNAGASDIPNSMYYGYTKCEDEIPEKFKNQILKLFDHPRIKQKQEEIMKVVRVNWSDNRAEQEYINSKWRLDSAIKKSKSDIKLYGHI